MYASSVGKLILIFELALLTVAKLLGLYILNWLNEFECFARLNSVKSLVVKLFTSITAHFLWLLFSFFNEFLECSCGTCP